MLVFSWFRERKKRLEQADRLALEYSSCFRELDECLENYKTNGTTTELKKRAIELENRFEMARISVDALPAKLKRRVGLRLRQMGLT